MEDSYRVLAKQLYAALEDASVHLEWCGYGDIYERSFAREARLQEKIEKVLEAAKLLLDKEVQHSL